MGRENIVVLNFGGPQAQLAARMIRNAKVYSEVLAWDTPIEAIRSKAPQGIVCIGGNADADAQDSPQFNKDLFSLCVPVLAMGYGMRALALAYDGRLDGWTFKGDLKKLQLPENELFEGVSGTRRFDRADRMTVPRGFGVLAAIDGVVIAMTNAELRCAAVQFTPESNDLESQRLLSNFALRICKCQPSWTVKVFIEEAVERIRSIVGSGTALLTLSGGVDSSVCAALMHKAIGKQLHCIMIDTGLLRVGEVELVKGILQDNIGLPLNIIEATDDFLTKLSGIRDAKEKRRAVREELDRIILHEATHVVRADYLVKGSIYTDRKNAPELGMKGFEEYFTAVIEPLSELFKDEVRACGEGLGLPAELIWRQPFPGPGFAVRCMGEVTKEKLDVLRRADQIFRQEILEAGGTRQIWQFFAVLSDHPSGSFENKDKPYVVVLRAVQSGEYSGVSHARLPYDLLERVVERILTELPQVERVLYDLTGQSAGIEWE